MERSPRGSYNERVLDRSTALRSDAGPEMDPEPAMALAQDRAGPPHRGPLPVDGFLPGLVFRTPIREEP